MLHFLARRLPLLLLLAAACTSGPSPLAEAEEEAEGAPPLTQLEGTWLISSEESHGDTLVYRPPGFAFPHRPGRAGFAVGVFGRFQEFDAVPTGGLTSRAGTWTADGDRRLHIHLDAGPNPDYTLRIISLKKKILRLQRQTLLRLE